MRTNIEKILVNMDYSIRQVLEILDIGAKGIVLVVDEHQKLIGTITDGDVRRAILRGIDLDKSIDKIVHYNPVSADQNMSREQLKDLFIKKAVKELPVIDENNVVLDMVTINDILLPEGKENLVVIMAGGLGTRIKDLTSEIPKPMLKIGDDPLLQHIINNFKKYGYNKMLISVNYKAEIIENYFQDGYAYGVKIEYIKEHKRLGTAGGIKLAEKYISKPFFVINGDIFSNLNAEEMMDFHIKNGFDITIGTRKHSFQIPYGVLKTDENMIKEIVEKPVIDSLINAGVYCLNSELVDCIPRDKYFEITELIDDCIKRGFRVGSYEIKDYWMDIGKIEDYKKVNEDFCDIIY